MPQADSLAVALKEWAVVCDALVQGRQMILLRKGGIYESGGEFELEHRKFFLFPTYLHQNLKMLKPSEHGGFVAATEEPKRVNIGAMGEVTDIVPVTSRAAMDRLDGEHIWGPPLIDMRFGYKPQNPLYLLIVRAWKLAGEVSLENTPAYAGCKSWVPLEAAMSVAVSVAGAVAVMDEARYQSRRRSILDRLAW